MATIILGVESEGASGDVDRFFGGFANQAAGASRRGSEFSDTVALISHSLQAARIAFDAITGAARVAFDAISSLTVQVANADEALGDFATAIGTTVENASRLEFAASKFGTTQEQLQMGVKGLTNKMFEAAKGSKEAAFVFDQLGISVTNTDGTLRDATQVMLQVSDRFAGMADGTQKSALAIKLFEESGLRLIPFLNQGSEEIGRFTEMSDRLGFTATTAGAAIATELSHNLRLLEKEMETVWTQIGRAFLPALNALAEEAVKTGDSLVSGIPWGLVRDRVMDTVEAVAALVTALAPLANIFIEMVDWVQFFAASAVAAFAEAGAAFNRIRVALMDGSIQIREALHLDTEEIVRQRDELQASADSWTAWGDQVAIASTAFSDLTDAAQDAASRALPKATDVIDKMREATEKAGAAAREHARQTARLPEAIPGIQQTADAMQAMPDILAETEVKQDDLFQRFDTDYSHRIPFAVRETQSTIRDLGSDLRMVGEQARQTGAEIAAATEGLDDLAAGRVRGFSREEIFGPQAPRGGGAIQGPGGLDEAILRIAGIDPHQAGALLVGRASAITGERLNSVMESIRLAQVAKREQEIRELLAGPIVTPPARSVGGMGSSEAGIGGIGIAIQQTMERAGERAREVLTQEIPSATASTIEAQKAIVEVNRELETSFERVASAAAKVTVETRKASEGFVGSLSQPGISQGEVGRAKRSTFILEMERAANFRDGSRFGNLRSR